MLTELLKFMCAYIIYLYYEFSLILYGDSIAFIFVFSVVHYDPKTFDCLLARVSVKTNGYNIIFVNFSDDR